MNEDLVLVPEVRARRALREQRVRLQVLVPSGAWVGCGVLRVLRVKMCEPLVLRQAQDEIGQEDKEVELMVGYESYQPASTKPVQANP